MRCARWAVAVVFLPLALLISCREGSRARPVAVKAGDIWIRNVTVVSPERATPLQHADVVIRENRIAFVGAALGDAASSTATVLDGTDRFLTPGLIDAHVHLAAVPGMSAAQEAALPTLVAAYEQQLPRSYLYFGFTTVIDLNVVDRARVQRLRNAAVGPVIYDCGNALAFANGYPMMALPADQRFTAYPNFLYDPRQARSIPATYTPAAHSPQAAVSRVVAGGGICVKAHYEPGFGAFAGALPAPTPDLLREVREAAHQSGLPFLLHANSEDAHRVAAAVRADVAVHGLWNWHETGTGSPVPTGVREVLDAERTAGVAVMPTSRVMGGLRDLADGAFLDRPELADVVPATLLAWWRSEDGQWFVRETLDGMSVERAKVALQALQTQGQRAAVTFAREGGRLLFGSDTPSAPTFANPPGLNGYLELRELEAAGFTPRELLVAATQSNARQFGLTDYGTIEVGQIGSVLLLRGDPLASTSAFDTIDTVVIGGRPISRRSLSAR